MTKTFKRQTLDNAIYDLICRHGIREIIDSMADYCNEQYFDAGEDEITVEEMMEPGFEIGAWGAACAFLERARDNIALAGEAGDPGLDDEDQERAA